VCECHAERRRLGHLSVGDGQRREAAADGERVHGHLAPGDELLDQHDARPGLAERERERVLELPLASDEHEPLLALTIGRLDHTRVSESGRSLARLLRGRANDVPRARDPGRGEPLALSKLRGREDRGRRIDRMRERQPLGDPGGDRYRPVDPGRDDPVDALGCGQPVDLGLVLDRDDRPAIGEAESGRGRVTVDGDDEEVSLAGRLEQAELAGPRP
jgi:hypothetical protein